jgi:exopolyphosphatase/guanosine-5'-triphosphate,3'-diphosphate pyrophosphatase
MLSSDNIAPGRLQIGAPVAIVDIGSNSVRLVAYEGMTRSPTPIYNEKVLCGLARGIVTTGRLAEDGMQRALAAIERFRMLCEILQVGEKIVVATAAARDASNGPDFLRAAAHAIGCEVTLLSGPREAELSARGVLSGVWRPDGVVGDLGGGSLELIELRAGKVGTGATLPLGGLSLMDASNKSLRQAYKITRRAIATAAPIMAMRGRSFYAVGGTWRAFAKLHMRQRNYPLQVMHNYTIPASDAADFAGLIKRVDSEAITAIGSVSAQRRPLLAYGAVVLDEIIRRARPQTIVFSVAGVREGLLYERLAPAEQAEDPLLVAAAQFNLLRSRSPRHALELADWIEAFWASTHIEDVDGEARLRRATSLLADIAWRAHPDYRGMQAFDLIVNASILGIDHPGRAFVALASAIRHVGLNEDVSPQVRSLVSARRQDHARILGATMRVAYSLSAAMAGILPLTPMIADRREVVVTLPRKLAELESERLANRLRQLARLIGREPRVVVAK